MRAKKRALGGPDTYTWSDPLARGLMSRGSPCEGPGPAYGLRRDTTGVTPRRQSTIARGFGGFEGVTRPSAASPGGCRAHGAGARRDPREGRRTLAAGAGPDLREGRRTLAAGGGPDLREGRRTLAAGGGPDPREGRRTLAAGAGLGS